MFRTAKDRLLLGVNFYGWALWCIGSSVNYFNRLFELNYFSYFPGQCSPEVHRSFAHRYDFSVPHKHSTAITSDGYMQLLARHQPALQWLDGDVSEHVIEYEVRRCYDDLMWLFAAI